jgi:hypothetical protein
MDKSEREPRDIRAEIMARLAKPLPPDWDISTPPVTLAPDLEVEASIRRLREEELRRVHAADAAADAAAEKPARERRPRKPTLASIAKQTTKAGIEVARYEVEPDGKIIVVTGKPQPEQTNDLDKWMAKRHAH